MPAISISLQRRAAPTRLQRSRSLRPNVNEYATDETPILGVPGG
jgi:hypothetical protein